MTGTTEGGSHGEPELFVEVRPQAGAVGNMSRPLPEQFRERSREIAVSIGIVAEPIQQKAEELAAAGGGFAFDELEVKFSVELQAETGVLIAKTSATGTFEVSLKWARK